MTSQPVHDRLDRTPTWIVQGVFDPDVKGQDFSYTIGLHERGLPELHLWASPTDGHDPGDDWAFSHNDRCRILNELAFAMIDGRLRPGSTVVRKYDHGVATVTFHVQPPGDRDALEALGIKPDALVLPVTWSLERAPIGPLRRLSSQGYAAAFREYDELWRSLPTHRDAPEGWEFSLPSFEPDQRFGPRTPIVIARAAQLWSARDLTPWAKTMASFGAGGSLTWPVMVARAAARPAGRSDAVCRVERDVLPLVDHVIDSRSDEWSAAIDAVAIAFGLDSRGDLGAIRLNVRDWLVHATLAVLSVEVVADVADRALLLGGRGPWLAALKPGRALPGPEWSAGPRVVRALRRQLRPLTVEQWSAIVNAHGRARGGGGAYNDLCWQLYFTYFTSAAGMPWSKLADMPAGREFKRMTFIAKEWPGIVEWASCLAALLTCRAQYSAAQVASFVEPVRDLLPDLERVVNALR